MALSIPAYAAGKKYTDETVKGGGAVKGKNCTIESITEIEGGRRVKFAWELDDGTKKTADMDVLDGEDGEQGPKGDKGDPGEKGEKGDPGSGGVSFSYSDNKLTISTY